jgi:tetratricopeptide (TPR) repeat protein
MAALAAACMLLVPAWAQQESETSEDRQRLQALLADGVDKMRAGKPAEALAEHFEPVAREYESRYRSADKKVYSSRSTVETLFYLLQGAVAEPKQSATVYSANWGLAYFLKGYALIELKRLPEAGAALDSAVALAPKNAQYLNERGQSFILEKNWDAARKIFVEAESAAREFSPEHLRTSELSRALRGQGYVQIELNNLDEAEKLYDRSLAMNKDDRMARGQLRYIAGLREKRSDEAAAAADPAMKDFVFAWRMAEAQFISPSVQSYARTYLTGVWNDQGTQRRADMPEQKAMLECITAIAPAPEKARMVFVIDDKGIITKAHTDQSGWVAECMQTKLVGHRIPGPPRAPLHYCGRYTKTGDDSYELSNCGPAPLLRSCERTGGATRCSVAR